MQLMSTRLKFFSIISKITFLSNLILFLLIYRYSNATDIACQTREIDRAITKNRDPFVQGLASVSEKHLKRKDAIFETFLGYLSKEKYLKRLTKRISDPKESSSLVTSFILCTSGPKSQQKFVILKRALLCLVQNHKMNKGIKGMADIHEFKKEYQPTSWDAMLKNLFSYFVEKDIQYNVGVNC